MGPTPTLADRCRAVDVLLLDVDGVMTGGAIVYAGSGEAKHFHVRDGLALRAWRQAGKRVAVVSGRTSPAVERRAAELEVDWLLQGVSDKGRALAQVLEAAGVGPERVAAVGDDLPDLPLLARCGLAVGVRDGCAEVRAAAHYVTRAPGGRAAVRETVERILRCQGRWPRAVE